MMTVRETPTWNNRLDHIITYKNYIIYCFNKEHDLREPSRRKTHPQHNLTEVVPLNPIICLANLKFKSHVPIITSSFLF